MYKFNPESRIKNMFTGFRLSVILFIAIVIFFIYSVGNISSDTVDRQEQSLRDALQRSIVSCYCVEGTYPPSLSYLTEHYGLTYDDTVFFVDYRPIASNMYPDVTILRRDK
jgi:hypothetical protein